VGLVSAALGVERDDHARLSVITKGYGVATALLNGSRPLLDFHTVQTPKEPALKQFAKTHGRRPATRAEQLRYATSKLGPQSILATTLSRRDYWCDVAVLIALWARDAAPEPLEALADALRQPRFSLALGRKACALMLPLDPMVSNFADAQVALLARRIGFELWRGATKKSEATVDEFVPCFGEIGLDRDDPATAAAHREIRSRRDVSRPGSLRLFDTRDEIVLHEVAP
jgi:CRISPR-associated protein Cas5/CasD subtype I-E